MPDYIMCYSGDSTHLDNISFVSDIASKNVH